MSVEVVVTRNSNAIRNSTCTVLQCPIVLTHLIASLVSTAVSSLKESYKAVKGSSGEKRHPLLIASLAQRAS